MFVRKKFDAARNRYRVQIVQSFRDGKKVRQKIIRHVGTAPGGANRIIKELVLARIAQPRSKRGTVMDRARDGGVTLNLDLGLSVHGLS